MSHILKSFQDITDGGTMATGILRSFNREQQSMITAIKLIPLAKTPPFADVATSTPATAGPTTRAPLNRRVRRDRIHEIFFYRQFSYKGLARRHINALLCLLPKA
jgi:hypothetical protein